MSAKKFKNPSKNVMKNLYFLNNNYLVARSAVGLLFITVGILFLSPLRNQGDVSRFMLTLIYSIVILLWVALMFEYFIKTLRLQKEEKVQRYSGIVSLNAILGLFLPIFKTY